MTVPPIGSFTPPVAPPLSAAKSQPASPAGTFGDLVAKGLEQVEGTQAQADAVAVQAASGELTDVHDLMIASTQAGLATELTVALRNKAVEAFNDIMRMPI